MIKNYTIVLLSMLLINAHNQSASYLVLMPPQVQLTNHLGRYATPSLLKFSKQTIEAAELYSTILGVVMDSRIKRPHGGAFIDTGLTWETFDDQTERLCKQCLQGSTESFNNFHQYLKSRASKQ